MYPQKTRLFLALLALAAAIAARSSAQPSHDPHVAPAQKADSILILKKDHTLELLSGGKIIRTTRSHSVAAASRPSNAKATPARPKATTSSTRAPPTAPTTALSTSPTPMPTTASAPPNSASLPAEPS